MVTVITADNLSLFAYTNESICRRPVRGIAVSFFGLGGQAMFSEDPPEAVKMAESGILYVIPYLNPWAWMNPQAVAQTDEILDALLDRAGCSALPVISSGGSMGGLSALIYTRYSRHAPVSCVANCPVCDLPYHYTERPDLPRTLYSAFGTFPAATLQEAMEAASPLHLAIKGDMPKVKYTIFHCTADQAVNKQMHSDRFVEAMEAVSSVDYHVVPDRGHCDLPPDMRDLYEKTIIDSVSL